MAANTPPLPHEEGAFFTNEETGVKYQFINGAWRAVGSKAVEDLLSQIDGAAIYYGDYEPVVDAYDLWYDTNRLELFVNYEGMWFPAAASSGGGGGGSQNLEQVLEQGNVADKGFILTNAENDALLVSPEEARIMVGGFGDDVIPRYELRHTDDRTDTAAVLLELDEGGKRFDIECDNKVENIHFRFGDEAKLDINKKGDAVFQGKVQVEPGTKDNEVVTFQQLQEIEEEIEDIRPTLERGVWEFVESGPSMGQFTLLRENSEEYCNAVYLDCIAEDPSDPTLMSRCARERDECIGNDPENPPRGYIDEWVSATELVTSNIDFDGVTHQWPDAEDGEFLELINEDGSGFALYQIEGEVNTAYQGRTRFFVKHMRSNGTPSGKAKVKLFAINEEVDPTEFVHKAGDSMSGRLSLVPKGNTPAFYIYPSEDVTENTYCIRQFGPYYTDPETGERKRDTVFYTTSAGYPSIHADHSPTSNRHLTPKKYVDDVVKVNVDRLYYPARFSWRAYTETSAGPAAGEIQFNGKSMSSSTEVRINFKSYDNKLDLYDVDDSTVVYSGPTNSSMMLTAYYIGSDSDNKWKWKGTANITKITVYKRTSGHYFKCDIGSYKTSNLNFTNGARYYFTLTGLF